MKTHSSSIGRTGLARALTVVWLLAGVFAMHGLTGNHDAATAFAHATHPAVQAASDKAAEASEPVMIGHELPLSDLTVQPAESGHGHAMGDVCLAMLTALALAILGALALRSVRAVRSVALRSGTRLAPAGAGLSPPWVQPTLSKLCVLRT